MERLTTSAQVDSALERPLAIFYKHSSACPICAFAHGEVEIFCARHAEVPVFLVRVIEERPISQYLARRTGVAHESPQVIVTAGGVARWHASHHGVTADAIAAHIR